MGKTLYRNAKVYTLNVSQPIASSFVADDDTGEIIEVGGSTSELDVERVHDLQGAVVLPGLIDAHTHLEVTAISQYINVDCRYPGVTKVADILERLQERADQLPEGEWVIGQGVHFQDQLMEEKRYPTREEFDQISTKHPIAFKSSFHITILNTMAMELAGITRDTPDPPGGIIERDQDGNPTGVTRDMNHLLGIPEPSSEERKSAFERCIRDDFLANGVTSLFEISHTVDSLEDLRDLKSPLRVGTYVHVPGTMEFDEALTGLPELFNRPDFFFAGIKLFIDGGTTSMAAAFNKPYTKDPSQCGTVAYDVAQLNDYLSAADEQGIQVAIHAVGDRAQDKVVAAMAELRDSDNCKGIQHRIEHGGNILCTPERQQELKEVGLIPVPNPGFLYTFGDSLGVYLGEDRTRFAYPFWSMIHNGLQPAAGGDCVGTDLRLCDPWFGMWCAVNRETRSGNKLLAYESIDLMSALLMYTKWSARSGGIESQVGSLEVGKKADFIVLDMDPFTINKERIKDIKPKETWIGGRCVYQEREQEIVTHS